MKSKITIAVLIVLLLSGCFAKQPQVVVDTPLRLTKEEIIESSDGDRIIIYYPIGVEKPVVIQSEETGGWIISAKVVEN